jgi:hypothetical protein
MPNWCVNRIKVKGPKSALENFILRAKGEPNEREEPNDLDFQKFVPMPDALKDTKSPSNGPNWYNWRLKNWGVKWPMGARVSSVSSKMVTYEGETPWVPPMNFLRTVSALCPTLTFSIEYWERGMEFQGKATFKNGEALSNWEGSYHGRKGG